ncbi:MAG: sigma-70 family RNA polymerase sigma factor [Gammaproteobacteria bacterium]|nr:sigma-70 family RNA polymerase sigma factor [Gammaproteobacteria bacterium]MDH5691521.1 sigma-70 family RNA polymerase sigma factor [Gammaproteobacteria bacterium]
MAVINGFRNQAAAYEALIRPHFEKLYRVAYRFTQNQDDAEDLVQELVTKMFSRYDELVNIERLDIWLSKVMYRIFIDDRRRYTRSPIKNLSDLDGDSQIEYEHSESEFGDPEEEATQDDFRNEVRRAMDSLSEDQKLLIQMFEIEGYSLDEISDMLCLPIGTVKSRLHRARSSLRDKLKNGTFSRVEAC